MSETSYPPEFVTKLEMQWGVGFLSPGGPEEVREILRDIDVKGKVVLDIGCGTGGTDIVIARDLEPERLVGIDIEPFLIDKGRKNIASAELEKVVDLRLVDAGPLPFEDQSFDIVFSKDSLIHFEDKATLYREVFRVLRPDGLFAASDWLRSPDADELEGYNEWRSLTGHSFSMQTAEETKAEMIAAGLEQVKTRDRNKWYSKTAAQEVKMMESDEWRSQYVAVFGEEGYAKGLALRIANARAAACGGLRPTHLHARRGE
ncbi:class I SAM-dependent methyltransferase [Seohaeicola saemankumensis]|uniref:Class I SAM-dependent methyltransferase n=1 Tax=Seohaeicola saemankumensis TaxID=481181 RepID=A0ABW3TII9_9RHOB